MFNSFEIIIFLFHGHENITLASCTHLKSQQCLERLVILHVKPKLHEVVTSKETIKLEIVFNVILSVCLEGSYKSGCIHLSKTLFFVLLI